MEAPFFFSIFLAPRLSLTYCSFHQQVVSVYVGTGGTAKRRDHPLSLAGSLADTDRKVQHLDSM